MAIKYLDAKRIRGLSSDTKPTNVSENTLFEETDSQAIFWRQSNAWVYGGAYEAISCGGSTNNEVAYNTTYISTGAAGGAWAASATMPDSIQRLGSSMGDSGRTTFFIWGGHNNTSGDNGELDNSYKFDGTAWGSNIDMNRNTNGCANGGGSSSGAMCCGGRDGNSGEYLINDTEKFNGSSWSDSGDVDTHLYNAGGDGDNTDYLRVGGTGSSNGQNPTFFTSTVQSYNGSSWSGSPTNLGTAISSNRYYGNTSDGIVIAGYNPNVTADVETYNGSSWTDVASIPVAKRDVTGGSNNTLASTKVIIWGGHFGSTNAVSDKSHLWNGTAWTEKNAIPVAMQQGGGGVKGL